MAAVLLACLPSYSYSEIIFGTTPNAASGYNWVMQNILPQQAGLEVTGVIYRYTTVKDPESDMVVYVQNEDAQNAGQYIFREVDDWSQQPGNTIYKLVPTDNILIDRWGDGSIEVEGDGEVVDPVVAYNYRYDPCFDPQSSPDCPGYVPPIPDIPEPDLTMIDEQSNKFIEENEEDKVVEADNEDQEERDRKKAAIQKKKENLEIALGATNSTELAQEAIAKHMELMALSVIPTTYTVSLEGGQYEETVQLRDGNLPVNKKARRVGLAQQLLHEQMVNEQYEQQ